MRSILLLLFYAASALPAGERKEAVHLKDGSVLLGWIVKEDDEKIVLEREDGSKTTLYDDEIDYVGKTKDGLERARKLRRVPEIKRERDKSRLIIGGRGAWGFPTGWESTYGANVRAINIGLKAGFEKKWIGVSLGLNYENRSADYALQVYTLDANYNPVLSTNSKYTLNTSGLDVPLFAEFYIPAGLVRPGLRIGPAYSTWWYSDNSGFISGSSQDISLNAEPVVKFLVTPRLEIGLDFRYQYFLAVLNSSYYSTDAFRASKMSLGIEAAFRI